MDVLFVILDSIALHKFFLICDSEFKLVECLSKYTLLWNLERLARVLRKPGLAIEFVRGGFGRFGPLHTAVFMAQITSVRDLWSKGTALPNLTHKLRVQSDTNSSGLATCSYIMTLKSVQFLSQGQSVYFAGVGRELFKDECCGLLWIHYFLLDEVVYAFLDLTGREIPLSLELVHFDAR